MKKSYSLDFDITPVSDRLAAVNTIIDTVDTTFSEAELEQMANYILCGKDPTTSKNAIDDHTISRPSTRHDTYSRRRGADVASIEELTENDAFLDQNRFYEINKGNMVRTVDNPVTRPKYDSNGNMTDPGDSLVPGMVDLWDSIDRMQLWLDMHTGKATPTEEALATPMTAYQIYKYKHWLVDMRRHQYTLRDSYCPRMYTYHRVPIERPDPLLNTNTSYWVTPEEFALKRAQFEQYQKDAHAHKLSDERLAMLDDPETKTLPAWQTPYAHTSPDPNSPILLKEWTSFQSTFDDENPDHIYCAYKYYDELYKASWEYPDSILRCILFDLDRAFDAAELSPIQCQMVEWQIQKYTYERIQRSIAEQYKLHLTQNQVTQQLTIIIPRLIAAASTKMRIDGWARNHNDYLYCGKCHQLKPRSPYYFTVNRASKTGFAARCKKCEKAMREILKTTKGVEQ